MDENIAISEAIWKRIEETPDDYYISDNGKVLYAILAGSWMWSFPAPDGTNFHTMQPTKIAMLIHEELSKKLG